MSFPNSKIQKIKADELKKFNAEAGCRLDWDEYTVRMNSESNFARRIEAVRTASRHLRVSGMAAR